MSLHTCFLGTPCGKSIYALKSGEGFVTFENDFVVGDEIPLALFFFPEFLPFLRFGWTNARQLNFFYFRGPQVPLLFFLAIFVGGNPGPADPQANCQIGEFSLHPKKSEVKPSGICSKNSKKSIAEKTS